MPDGDALPDGWRIGQVAADGMRCSLIYAFWLRVSNKQDLSDALHKRMLNVLRELTRQNTEMYLKDYVVYLLSYIRECNLMSDFKQANELAESAKPLMSTVRKILKNREPWIEAWMLFELGVAQCAIGKKRSGFRTLNAAKRQLEGVTEMSFRSRYLLDEIIQMLKKLNLLFAFRKITMGY